MIVYPLRLDAGSLKSSRIVGPQVALARREIEDDLSQQRESMVFCEGDNDRVVGLFGQLVGAMAPTTAAMTFSDRFGETPRWHGRLKSA